MDFHKVGPWNAISTEKQSNLPIVVKLHIFNIFRVGTYTQSLCVGVSV